MKGITKAIMRTPHLMTSKVGMAKKSNDVEFDEYNRNFTILEGAAEQLMKDSRSFSEHVIALLAAGAQFSTHFANIFTPLPNEYNLESSHPEAAPTIKHVALYQNEMEELRQVLAPELELIDSRIVGPIKELQGIMKLIRKNITKRDHKLMDYDRFNNSLSKLKEKKEKTLSDEKSLFKLEQDFERSVQEYEMFNTALKTDLPQFMVLATQFIDPLFHSFFYMQLNIYYLMLEKLQSFAEKKYHTGGDMHDVIASWEEKRGDMLDRLEAMTITHRIVSTAKLLSNRSPGGLGASRAASTTSSLSGGRPNALSPTSKFGQKESLSPNAYTDKFASLASKKGAAPPPPSAGSAPPPPYSSSRNASSTSLDKKSPAATFGIGRSTSATGSSVATKKAPPPPPPLKPKPSAPGKPAPVYVTALYDFEAQADGDLSFKIGDRIELVERTPNQEDWWTGRLNGAQGVFPGNYVQA